MAKSEFELTTMDPLDALSESDTRLVDVIDGLLDHGVVIRGELRLTVADVDLAFVGLDVVLANPDTMKPTRPTQ